LRQQIRCHGDPERFGAVAGFIYERFGENVKYIADVAGGQGALSRILNKKYNYSSEVIDPRGHTLKGVPGRREEYRAESAGYYDLIVGLHPDEALMEVVKSAETRPVLLVPCCNFFDKTKRLGTKALLDEICRYFDRRGIRYERIALSFRGPKNIGILTRGKG
jgi:hypothetical protein